MRLDIMYSSTLLFVLTWLALLQLMPSFSSEVPADTMNTNSGLPVLLGGNQEKRSPPLGKLEWWEYSYRRPLAWKLWDGSDVWEREGGMLLARKERVGPGPSITSLPLGNHNTYITVEGRHISLAGAYFSWTAASGQQDQTWQLLEGPVMLLGSIESTAVDRGDGRVLLKAFRPAPRAEPFIHTTNAGGQRSE